MEEKSQKLKFQVNLIEAVTQVRLYFGSVCFDICFAMGVLTR